MNNVFVFSNGIIGIPKGNCLKILPGGGEFVMCSAIRSWEWKFGKCGNVFVLKLHCAAD